MTRTPSLPAFRVTLAALAFLAVSPAHALDAPRAVPETRAQTLLSFSPVVKRAQPADF